MKRAVTDFFIGQALRRAARLLCCCSILSTLPMALLVAEEEDQDSTANHSALDRSVDDARQMAGRMVDGALDYLAANLRQRGDGSFERNPGKDPTIAKTALGALAFFAAGHTVDHGPYVPEVRQSIRWILSRTKPVSCDCDRIDGAHDWAQIFDPNDTLSRMHGHGYATWALALAYGMTFGARNEQDRKELKTKLEAAVHCIELAQTESGGWGYEYQKGTFHEGSVTITQLQALRAAREAGVEINSDVIDRAVGYIRNSQVKSGPKQGGFRYKLGNPNVSFPLTAAAVSALNQTGIYDGEIIDLGLAYMRETDPLTSYKADANHRYYGRIYATQCYWQYRELRHFRRYYPNLIEQLSRERNPENGSFSGSEYGDVYATAMSALTMAVPFGYLPSFQR